MIKEEFIQINGHPRNYKHFKSLGYDVIVGKPSQVKTKDLMPGTTTIITTICDYCCAETTNTFKDYYIYTKGLIEPFFCRKCNSIKNKITSMINWGVDNPMKSDEVKERLKKSLLEKYGVSHYSSTSEYKEKYKSTCRDKYGFENTFQVDEFKKKSKLSSREKWGVDYYLETQELRQRSKVTKESNTRKKFEKLIKDEYEIEEYTDEIFKIYHSVCMKKILIPKALLIKRNESGSQICTICNPVNIQESYIEIDLKNFITSLGIKFISRDKKILNGKELDIYIPEFNLAIEINGIYWHSEIFKSKDYHLEKTLNCAEKGINLLHIWEDDWLQRKEVVKSIIRNRLHLIQNRVFARKCVIKNVDTKLEKEFLNQNHIQGWSTSQIKIGLFNNDELVSLMTFGYRKTNGKREMELIRFCNKLNTSVIGSASKLLNHFIKTNNIKNIVSYSDISIFDGMMYEKIGFKKVSLSKPNYYWVVDKKRRHRYNFSKKKLVSKGFDENLSEVKIMHQRGFYRVWGCGQIRWELSIT